MDAGELRTLDRDDLGLSRYGVGPELRHLPELLLPGERVERLATGVDGKLRPRNGRLTAATDRRMVVLGKPWRRPLICSELPYEKLTRVVVDDAGSSGSPSSSARPSSSSPMGRPG